ncbi:MAG TPA: ketopantoate reductase family protein [Candidatus Limiplasma sp.]|nr:ketopantoate reductase family protein [Candidatus Limiplasma sp.]HPS80943.1 ketopantoate reductase family protein [Candidatus Limiplasma sp.]
MPENADKGVFDLSDALRIVIVGAGAIGGITAARMKKGGCDVTLVCKHQDTATLASGRGLHITGVLGEATVPVRSVAAVEELTGFFDVALIATKAYDMPQAAKHLLPFLKPDSFVFSLQNGICTDALAHVVGAERTVGCVIGWGATMHSAGDLEMTSRGEFIIGRIEGDNRALEPARAALSTVIDTVISDDIFAELYSKLIVNSCITSLGAICGLRLGEMLKRKQARRIFLSVIGEAMAVAHAMRLTVPPFGGRLDYDRLMRGNGALDNLRRHVMIFLVGLKYRNLKSSSLQSLERGRPTEIDYFNGYIAAKGEALAVPCPVNRRLTVMVKEIENGKRSMKVENLYDEAFTA